MQILLIPLVLACPTLAPDDPITGAEVLAKWGKWSKNAIAEFKAAGILTGGPRDKVQRLAGPIGPALERASKKCEIAVDDALSERFRTAAARVIRAAEACDRNTPNTTVYERYRKISGLHAAAGAYREALSKIATDCSEIATLLRAALETKQGKELDVKARTALAEQIAAIDRVVAAAQAFVAWWVATEPGALDASHRLQELLFG